MKKLLVIGFAVMVCVVLAASLWPVSRAQKLAAVPAADPVRQAAFDKLIDSAKQAGGVRVIAGLNMAFRPEGDLRPPEAARQQLDIRQAQEAFLSRFFSLRKNTVKQFTYIPFLAFEADAVSLEQMRNDPFVLSIQEDELAEPALAESTGIVGAPAAWSSGYTGSGQTVAILDTGVDKNHTFLSGKVVSEACYSSNIVGSNSTSVCPGGVTESTAVNSGLNCSTTIDGCAHGTHVAGIAAGKGASFSGVAKDANIIAIQVFSRIDGASCGAATPCARYWTSDLIKGLERVKTLSLTMNNIAAVNLSLQTGQQFTSNCDAAHAATKAAVDNLRSVGIATVICAGNFAFTNALTAPACISTSVSVGSVDDGSLGTSLDTVSSFSDSSPLLHLLAPGRWINSSVPGNAFSNFFGTSMATPHVVGAFAVLRQRSPGATVNKIQNALIATGQPITDSRNGIVKPRLKVDAALQLAAKVVPFDYEGDGKSDISIFRPSTGVWFVQRSSDGGLNINQWGAAGDMTVPSDYDGDMKTDIAVWRPSNGVWFWINSSNGTVGGNQFGISDDKPVPGDFDGDGKADIAIFRPATGTWWIYRSSDSGVTVTPFGIAEDKPAVGDFDGDAKADLSVFRPSNGTWFRLNSSNGAFVAVNFGLSEDKPVAADYDNDNKADIAIWRPSNGAWYWINSSNQSVGGVFFGISEDKPTPGDYDGDGKADPAVFRPSQNTWYLLRSTQGFTAQQFGAAGDIPTPNSFVW